MRGRCAGIETQSACPITEMRRQPGNMGAFGIKRGKDIEAGVNGAQNLRRQGGRINQTAATVHEIVPHGLRARHVGAIAAKSL